jgi:hypothetical protein
MKMRWAAVAVFVLVCTWAVGQHGLDPIKLGGSGPRDTWTGTVKSLDHATGTITLEHEHKGNVESFTGVLKPPLLVMDEKGNAAKPPIHINMGDHLTVHYIKEGSKYTTQEGGKKHDEVANANLIVQINFLAGKN